MRFVKITTPAGECLFVSEQITAVFEIDRNNSRICLVDGTKFDVPMSLKELESKLTGITF